MLFLAHCASKLSPADKNGQGGRAAVVSNASPPFASDKGSNAIRQWLPEENLTDVIVALTNSTFYATGTGTSLWVLARNKEPEHQGKHQPSEGTGTGKHSPKQTGKKHA